MAKVLIIAPYSHPSKCGVWTRAWSDAKFLKSQGYDVTIFSSDIVKGTRMRSGSNEILEDIKIQRFPVLFSMGGSSMFWFFSKAFNNLKPDFVHTHGYRHPHSLLGLILGKLKGSAVFLTTHAPFEKDSSRSIILKLIDTLYDFMIGWWQLKLYKKVIRISFWEEKYLKALGLKNSIYIPNGLSNDYLKNQIKIDEKPKKRAIFMGRIDPVKRLEWIVYSAKEIKSVNFYIRGALNIYEQFLPESSNLEVDTTPYNSTDFKFQMQKSDIYIMPSIREALPFTLLEAMSQGLIPLSSTSNGGKEVITDGENGFLFSSKEELVEKIDYVYQNWSKMNKIRQNAIKTAQSYSLEKINQQLLELYK